MAQEFSYEIEEYGFDCVSRITSRALAVEIYRELKIIDLWLAVEFWNRYEYFQITGRKMA